MDQRDAAIRLAALKGIIDLATAEQKRIKALGVFDPKDRKSAVLEDGTDIGTISCVPAGEGFVVEDAGAFLKWVKANGRPEDVVTVEKVTPDAERRILAEVETLGVLPDGVGYVIGDPVVRVSATKDQKRAFAEAISRGTLGAAAFLELEGRDGVRT